MDSNIYVIGHKKIEKKLKDNYIPLQVGKANTGLELGYLSDDTEKNIARKNANYCELTGLYWVWKNAELSKYIGFCHYRRFFVKGFWSSRILTDTDISEIMKKADVILPKKLYFENTVWDNYFKGGRGKEKDLKELKNIILQLSPEYSKAFEQITQDYGTSYCNMFVMKKQDFENYMEWLFLILEELERRTDISDYTKEEARIYGYLSEILLNVWIAKQGLRIKECYVERTDRPFYKNIGSRLKNNRNAKAKEKRNE